jgi:PAS domain S-box-containing protein
LLTVFLLSIGGLVTGWFIMHSRSRLIDDAAGDLAQISLIVADQLSERIRLLDDIIQQSGTSYQRRFEQSALDTAEMDNLLENQVADIGGVAHVLGIVTPDGMTRYSSRGTGSTIPYTGDRSYFRRHRDDGQRVLLSGPIISRSDGKPTFYITRRIDDSHGEFLGIGFASIDPTVFEHDLARMGLPEGAEAALLTPEGGLVAHFPAVTGSRVLTSGDTPTFAFQDTPPVTAKRLAADALAAGGPRLTYHVPLTGLPITLYVSVPKSAFLGLWYEDIQSIAIVAAAIAAALIAVLAGLYRQLRINDAHTVALARTQASLETAQSMAQLGSWRWNPGRRSFELSQQFAKLLGIESGGAIRPGRLWRAIHPGDRRRLRDAWRKLTHGDATRQFDLRLVRPDGEVRHVLVDARPDIVQTGKHAGAFGTVLDITQRDRIEQERRRWADAFENAAYGIAITDARTALQISVNPAYAAMHGMTPAELTGASVAALYAPEEAENRRAAVATSDRTGHVEFDTIRIRPDGSRFPVRIWLTTVPHDAGRPLYRIATVLDMTERRSIEQQLAQARKMEAIGNLTGGIAHDFNNLLSVIVIDLDTLAILLKDNKDAAAMVSDCLTAALSGASLTQRLLAFARRQTLAPSRVSINGLVTGMVGLLRRTLGEHIVVSLELDPGLWPVFVDPAQLEASLLNLAVNARDAMPLGGHLSIATGNKHIDAECARRQPELAEGDYATIMVTDSGTGMPEDVKARIFEPFYTTKERGRGSGLGLSMVFGFMRQSNGLVTVYSEPGNGAVFRLYLPRSTVDAAAETRPVIVPLTGGRGETILVAEDNELLRASLVHQLTLLDYRVLEAADAAAALTLLKTHPVQLVFTDVVMPGVMDGIGLAREIVAGWPETKIVLTSGFADRIFDGDGLNLPSSVRFLHKPFRRDELAHMIRDTLDS